MKQAKNIKVGSVVKVPTYHSEPSRKGWNGWEFTVGIVRQCGTVNLKKSGTTKAYLVEYPVNYDHANNKITATKVFAESKIFEASMFGFKTNLQHEREEFCGGCYGAETEFLIDNGIL